MTKCNVYTNVATVQAGQCSLICTNVLQTFTTVTRQCWIQQIWTKLPRQA